MKISDLGHIFKVRNWGNS